MKRQNARDFLIGLLVVIGILIAVMLAVNALGWSPAGIRIQRVPQLVNPGFEGDFYESGGVGELTVAEGWSVWFDPDPTRHRPEYKPECVGVGKGRVRSGTYAQKLFTTFSAHDAGIYQEIYGVEPGTRYQFSIWAYQWSSAQHNPDESEGDGKCSALVGINPWGDANPLARTTVWGREALQVYNEWVQVDVVAEAWSDKIVVAFRQDCEWPVTHNDGYIDDAHLEPVSVDSVPTSTPYPTYTPLPTYTPEPTQACPTGEPGVGIDYERVRDIVETVVADRNPVRWPR